MIPSLFNNVAQRRKITRARTIDLESNSKPPTKEMSLAVALLILGTIIISIGLFMFSQQFGGDRTYGLYMIFNLEKYAFNFSSISSICF
jgi:hypothetical protein